MLDFRREGLRPLVALRALRALLRDPDDTERVFQVLDALAGRSDVRLLARFRRTSTGAHLLQRRPSLRDVLSDLASLRSHAEGTLGRAYAEFMTREGISADGLLQASRSVRDGSHSALPEDADWLRERIRDMHDLWHVVTGYGRDMVGEGALVAFTFAQTRHPGFGFMLAGIYIRAGYMSGARRTIRDAWRRGRRAAWLPAQDWEGLLARQLDELRSELALGAQPVYRAVRSDGAPGAAS